MQLGKKKQKQKQNKKQVPFVRLSQAWFAFYRLKLAINHICLNSNCLITFLHLKLWMSGLKRQVCLPQFFNKSVVNFGSFMSHFQYCTYEFEKSTNMPTDSLNHYGCDFTMIRDSISEMIICSSIHYCYCLRKAINNISSAIVNLMQADRRAWHIFHYLK